MLDPALLMLCLVILAALLFDYINGFHDTANAIATCVSTRALSVKAAIIMAAILNFTGAMISTKVASTIGKGIVDKDNITQMVVLAGISGAIIWDLITWYYGLPSSSSHAIIGGHHGSGICPCRYGRSEMERSEVDHPRLAYFPDHGNSYRLRFHDATLPDIPELFPQRAQ